MMQEKREFSRRKQGSSKTSPVGALASLFLLTLLILPLVSADYNIYTTHSNDNTHKRNILGTYLDEPGDYEYRPAASGTTGPIGSIIEPVVYDYDLDGVNDLIMDGTGDAVVLVRGDDVTAEVDSMELGDLYASPVACDINNDGNKEYVGIYQQNASYYLNVLTVENDELILIDQEQTNATSTDANIICSQFYSNEGDMNYYLHWLDTGRLLHEAEMSTGNLTDSTSDSEGGAADYSGSNIAYSLSSTIVLLENFEDDVKTLVYMQGRYLHAVESDGTDYDRDIFSDLGNPYFGSPNLGRVILIGDVTTKKSGGRVFVGFTQSTNYGSPGFFTQIIPYATYRRGSLGFSLDLSGTFSGGLNTGVSVQASYARGKCCGQNTDMIFMKHQFSGVSVVSQLRIWNPENGTTMGTYALGLGRSAVNADYRGRNFYVIGTSDILSIESGQVWLYEGANYSSGQVNLFNVTNTGEKDMPVLVDIDKDGYLDFYRAQASITEYFMSATVSTTAAQFPFQITQNNTVGLFATTRVDTLFNDTEADYNVAAVCSLESDALWSEIFRTTYNFTTQNVSFNIQPPEDFLTFDGMSITLGGNFSSFDLTKYHTVGVRDNTEFIAQMISPDNRSIDIISFSDDNLFTSYYRLNKTGTNIEVLKVVPFSGIVSLGNATVGAAFTFTVRYSPVLDSFSGQKYFDTEVYLDSTLVATTSTAQFSGENIKNVEVFTNDDGEFTLTTLSFSEMSDVTPEFVQFQNGIVNTIEGVTFTFPAPIPQIDGEGFEVLPDYNTRFYIGCTYPEAGTYTQRIYLSPDNTIDYTNYEELTFTLTGDDTTTQEGFVGDLSDDPFIQGFEDNLELFGLSSTAGKLFVAFLIVFVSAAIGFAYSAVFGVISGLLSLVLMVMFGFIPIWVVVVLGIFAALAIAAMFRRVFGGDSNG